MPVNYSLGKLNSVQINMNFTTTTQDDYAGQGVQTTYTDESYVDKLSLELIDNLKQDYVIPFVSDDIQHISMKMLEDLDDIQLHMN